MFLRYVISFMNPIKKKPYMYIFYTHKKITKKRYSRIAWKDILCKARKETIPFTYMIVNRHTLSILLLNFLQIFINILLYFYKNPIVSMSVFFYSHPFFFFFYIFFVSTIIQYYAADKKRFCRRIGK